MKALTSAELVICVACMLAACLFIAGKPRGFIRAVGAIAALAALWALGVAVVDAVTTGAVSLPTTRGRARPVVPWPAAWAYFLGFVLFIAATSLPLLTRRDHPRRSSFVAVGAAGAVMGSVLALLSGKLSSGQGLLFLLGMGLLLGCIGWLRVKFGRWPAMLLWCAVVGCVVWKSQSGT